LDAAGSKLTGMIIPQLIFEKRTGTDLLAPHVGRRGDLVE
jgi:hypothetical protein